MKICVISTTVIKVPPTGYSGLEMIAYLQARELAKRGHKVLLVCPWGSTAPPDVELHCTILRESEMNAYGAYKERLKNFDIILDNSWEKWAVMSRVSGELKAPVLCVVHAPPHTMYQKPPPLDLPCIVAISQDQAVAVSEAWGVPSRVAYNGIDTDLYKRGEAVRNGRYLFLARMSRIKGPQIAVDIARKLRLGLDLVGDDKLTGEPALAQRLMRLSTNGITYHGPITREKTIQFFSTRKVLLHMNQIYREPFGMVPVESQLCGLAVIAFDNGAMRETVKHGETGFLVKTPEEVEKLISANAIKDIKPERCREWASQFSVKAMVDKYEALCQEAIETGGW